MKFLVKGFIPVLVGLLIGGILVLPSCVFTPGGTEFKVDKMAEVDGHTIYRFYDCGRYHWYVMPGGHFVETPR